MVIPAQDWLRSRVGRDASRAVSSFLADAAADVATATSDAVAIRALTASGDALVPVAAHHPDPERGRAMLEVMTGTTPAREGLWRRVVDERRPARWYVPPGAPPAEASTAQADFLRQHSVRAVLGVPLLWGADVVGGVAMIRFSVDRPFTDDDETLLASISSELAAALHIRTQLEHHGSSRWLMHPATVVSLATRRAPGEAPATP